MKVPDPVKLENMEGPSKHDVGDMSGVGCGGWGCLAAFVIIAFIWIVLSLPGWEFVRWLFILK